MTGIKIAYLPKIELVVVQDTSKAVTIETLPQFKLVVIVPEVTAATRTFGFVFG